MIPVSVQLIRTVTTESSREAPLHLSYDGKNILFHSWHHHTIDIIDKNGKLIRQLTDVASAARGICFDGKDYITIRVGPGGLFHIDRNGNLIRTTTHDYAWYDGIEFDGRNFRLCQNTFGRWDYYDRNGKLLDAVTLSNAKSEDLCFDGKNYWVIDPANVSLWLIAPDGTELEQNIGIAGVGVCFDGKFIYTARAGTTNLILYQYAPN